ncbi:MAG: hypothetical protein PHU71_07070, partial [Candidatus Gracilibacteria bacterium]|nr:hypothetical protein [Candidatus Gracilibacteria bacterium]
TPKGYDFGKFQKAIEEGKITPDVLDEIATDVPNWLVNINKKNKIAADNANKVTALKAELEKQLAGGQVSQQKIDKPENHPAVQAMKRLVPQLIKDGMDKDSADSLLERVTAIAQDEIERQGYAKISDIDKLFQQRAKEQAETRELSTGAQQLTEKYKDVIDTDTAVSLIAAFSDEDDTPGIGLKKAMAFIETIKVMALREPKPKPRATIVSPGAAPIIARPMDDDDKKLAEMQAAITARHTKG